MSDKYLLYFDLITIIASLKYVLFVAIAILPIDSLKDINKSSFSA